MAEEKKKNRTSTTFLYMTGGVDAVKGRARASIESAIEQLESKDVECEDLKEYLAGRATRRQPSEGDVRIYKVRKNKNSASAVVPVTLLGDVDHVRVEYGDGTIEVTAA